MKYEKINSGEIHIKGRKSFLIAENAMPDIPKMVIKGSSLKKLVSALTKVIVSDRISFRLP